MQAQLSVLEAIYSFLIASFLIQSGADLSIVAGHAIPEVSAQKQF